MKHLVTSLPLTALLALPLGAQELNPALLEIGRLTLDAGDASGDYLAVTDPESGRSSVVMRITGGFITINLGAGVVDESTEPNDPYASLIFGPFSAGAPVQDAQMQLYVGETIFGADIDTGTRVAISDFRLSEDGQLSFSLSGTLAEATSDMGAMSLVEGGQSLEVTGSYSGLAPLQ